jgi:hypothetical protein
MSARTTNDARAPQPGTCRFCGQPRPVGYQVTCGKSECQQQAWEATDKRSRPAQSPARKLTHDGQTASPQAMAIGLALARKVFAKRGDHSEVHLAEVTLAAMLAIAADQGARQQLQADEETER